MKVEDLAAIVDASQHSAFRLETLPQYLVPQEAEEYEAWRAGRPVPLQTPDTSQWLAKIHRMTQEGYRWSRVHIVDWPLADYTRFELHGYRANVAAGEDVRIADRHAHPDMARLDRDFWLIDDRTAVWMHYDAEGRFVCPRLADVAETNQCRAMRDLALTHAEPLDDYLARARPRLTA